MEKLQKEFGNRIQIILVNAVEDEQKVRAVFAQRKRLENLNITLPTVCLDSNIKKIFPYSGLPQEVWIDPSGLVKSITSGNLVTSKNISSLLAKKEVNIPQIVRNDKYFSAKCKKPFFVEGNGGNITFEDVVLQSVLTKHIPLLLGNSTLMANAALGYFCCCTNICIRDLYRVAYSEELTPKGLYAHQESEEVPLSKTVLELPDTSRYVDLVNDETITENQYVYHIISPPTTLETLKVQMRNDLRKAFGLSTHWERRKKTCYVLSSIGAGPIPFKAGETNQGLASNLIDINNISVDVFIQRLISNVYYFSPYPFVNETGFKGSLGAIRLEANVLNPKALDKALRPFGLRFKTATRWVKVLVLRPPRPAIAQSLKS